MRRFKTYVQETFDPKQPRDTHGRWSKTASYSSWSKDGEDDGTAKKGDTVLVTRVGSSTGGLERRNGGNLNAVGVYMLKQWDDDGPSNAMGDTVSLYSVTLDSDPTEGYQMLTKTRDSGPIAPGGREAIGRMVNKWSDGDVSVAYSFPSKVTAKLIKQVPVKDIVDSLKKDYNLHGPGSAGTIQVVDTLKKHLS